MTLHERITAAVEKRLAVAQAATAMPFGMLLVPPWTEFLRSNHPARIIRDCRRDLKVLARHTKTLGGCCLNCCDSRVHRDFGLATAYPCPDVRDLAEAYEIGAGDGDG